MPEFITNKFNWLKSCKSNKDCPSPIVIRIWWTLTDFFSHRTKKFTCSWENSSKGNALTPLLSDNLLTFQTVRIFSVSINLPYKTVSTLFSLGHVINFPSKLPMSLFFAVAIVGLQSFPSEVVSHSRQKGPNWEFWDFRRDWESRLWHNGNFQAMAKCLKMQPHCMIKWWGNWIKFGD